MQFSTSKIKCYKSCPRSYYFKYVEGLTCLDEKTDALQTGSDYHKCLEDLYNTGDFTLDIENNPKVSAMACAYKKYIYPQFKVKCAEMSFEKKLNEHTILTGRYDGIAEDGNIVEHKTTSLDIGEEYLYKLQWDEQVLNYMLANGTNKIYYTVCKKPTLRQGVKETAQEYFNRCLAWYDTDTDSKIRVIKVERSVEEIEKQKMALCELSYQMDVQEQMFKVKGDIVFYRNSGNCMQYGSKCIFSPICLEYKPDMVYVNFTKQNKTKTDDLPF